jgi:hypothetical protein
LFLRAEKSLIVFSLRPNNSASVGCPCTDLRVSLYKFERAADLFGLKMQVFWLGVSLNVTIYMLNFVKTGQVVYNFKWYERRIDKRTH